MKNNEGGKDQRIDLGFYTEEIGRFCFLLLSLIILQLNLHAQVPHIAVGAWELSSSCRKLQGEGAKLTSKTSEVILWAGDALSVVRNMLVVVEIICSAEHLGKVLQCSWL